MIKIIRTSLLLIRIDFLIQRKYKLELITSILSKMSIYIIFLLLAIFTDYYTGMKFFYSKFILTGIVVDSILSSALYTPSLVFIQEYKTGRLDLKMILPLSIKELIYALTLKGMLWSVVENSIFIVCWFYFLIYTLEKNVVLSLHFIIVTILALYSCLELGFLCLGITLSLEIRGFNPMVLLIRTFFVIVSGIYFPLEILPTYLRVFSLISPYYYLANIIRGIKMNVSHLMIMIITAILYAIIGSFSLNTGIKNMIRKGLWQRWL
ncbi:MAG: hypothetical protein DRN04_10325 [Thermoprotei archaeon]|nr:MAG: hypothetical protein DRN04_10325 [Thermoprotei archaeon]